MRNLASAVGIQLKPYIKSGLLRMYSARPERRYGSPPGGFAWITMAVRIAIVASPGVSSGGDVMCGSAQLSRARIDRLPVAGRVLLDRGWVVDLYQPDRDRAARSRVRLAPGTSLRPGVPYMAIDLSAWLYAQTRKL
jgi:hypothetical protein